MEILLFGLKYTFACSPIGKTVSARQNARPQQIVYRGQLDIRKGHNSEWFLFWKVFISKGHYSDFFFIPKGHYSEGSLFQIKTFRNKNLSEL